MRGKPQNSRKGLSRKKAININELNSITKADKNLQNDEVCEKGVTEKKNGSAANKKAKSRCFQLNVDHQNVDTQMRRAKCSDDADIYDSDCNTNKPREASTFDYDSDEDPTTFEICDAGSKRKRVPEQDGGIAESCSRYKRSHQALVHVSNSSSSVKEPKKRKISSKSSDNGEKDFLPLDTSDSNSEQNSVADKSTRKPVHLAVSNVNQIKLCPLQLQGQNKKGALNLKKRKVEKQNFDFESVASESGTSAVEDETNKRKPGQAEPQKVHTENDSGTCLGDLKDKGAMCSTSMPVCSSNPIDKEILKAKKDERKCPVCNKLFSASESNEKLTEHVNSCIDNVGIKKEVEYQTEDAECDPRSSHSILRDQLVTFEYQRTELAQAEAGLEGSDGLFFCHICQKDLSKMNSQRRQQHMNKCCDKTEEIEPLKENKEQTRTAGMPSKLTCPICDAEFKASRSRQIHIKKCAKKNGVPMSQVLEIMHQEQQRPSANHSTERGMMSVNANDNSGPVKKKRKVATNIRGLDEETQLAMALSASMAPPATIDDGLTRKMRGRKKKGNDVVPALLLRSEEETQHVIAARAAQVVCNQNDDDMDEEISCTPALAPSSLAQQFNREEKQDAEETPSPVSETNTSNPKDSTPFEDKKIVDEPGECAPGRQDVDLEAAHDSDQEMHIIPLSKMLASSDMCKSFLSFLHDDEEEKTGEENSEKTGEEKSEKETNINGLEKKEQKQQAMPVDLHVSLWSLASLRSSNSSTNNYYVSGLLPPQSPPRQKKTPKKSSSRESNINLLSRREVSHSATEKSADNPTEQQGGTTEESCDDNAKLGDSRAKLSLPVPDSITASQAVNLDILMELAEGEDDSDVSMVMPRKSSCDDDVFPASGFCLPVGQTQQEKTALPSPLLSSLLSDFSAMLSNPILSDVIIVAKGNNEIPAHKFMLATRSNILAEMLQVECQQQNPSDGTLGRVYLKFEDTEADVVYEVLKYIYTATADVPLQLLDGVIELADRLQLAQLVKACQGTEGTLDIQQNEKEYDELHGRKETTDAEELLDNIWQENNGSDTEQVTRQETQEIEEGFDDDDIEEIRIFQTQANRNVEANPDRIERLDDVALETVLCVNPGMESCHGGSEEGEADRESSIHSSNPDIQCLGLDMDEAAEPPSNEEPTMCYNLGDSSVSDNGTEEKGSEKDGEMKRTKDIDISEHLNEVNHQITHRDNDLTVAYPVKIKDGKESINAIPANVAWESSKLDVSCRTLKSSDKHMSFQFTAEESTLCKKVQRDLQDDEVDLHRKEGVVEKGDLDECDKEERGGKCGIEEGAMLGMEDHDIEEDIDVVRCEPMANNDFDMKISEVKGAKEDNVEKISITCNVGNQMDTDRQSISTVFNRSKSWQGVQENNPDDREALDNSVSLLSDESDGNDGDDERVNDGPIEVSQLTDEWIIPETPRPKKKAGSLITLSDKVANRFCISPDQDTSKAIPRKASALLTMTPPSCLYSSEDSSNDSDSGREDANEFLTKLRSRIKKKQPKPKGKKKKVTSSKRNSKSSSSQSSVKKGQRADKTKKANPRNSTRKKQQLFDDRDSSKPSRKRNNQSSTSDVVASAPNSTPAKPCTPSRRSPGTGPSRTPFVDLSIENPVMDSVPDNVIQERYLTPIGRESWDSDVSSSRMANAGSSEEDDALSSPFSPTVMLSPRLPSPSYFDFEVQFSPQDSPTHDQGTDDVHVETPLTSVANHSTMVTPMTSPSKVRDRTPLSSSPEASVKPPSSPSILSDVSSPIVPMSGRISKRSVHISEDDTTSTKPAVGSDNNSDDVFDECIGSSCLPDDSGGNSPTVAVSRPSSKATLVQADPSFVRNLNQERNFCADDVEIVQKSSGEKSSGINTKKSLFQRLKATKYGLEKEGSDGSSDLESSESNDEDATLKDTTPSRSQRSNKGIDLERTAPSHSMEFYDDGGYNCDVDEFEDCLDGDDSFMANAAEKIEFMVQEEEPQKNKELEPGTSSGKPLSSSTEKVSKNYGKRDQKGTNTRKQGASQGGARVESQESSRKRPQPVTPMPEYTIMDTPELRNEVNKFGVRALPKKKMINKLKELYHYTHPGASTDHDAEVQTKKGPRLPKQPAVAEGRAKQKTLPASQRAPISDSDNESRTAPSQQSRASQNPRGKRKQSKPTHVSNRKARSGSEGEVEPSQVSVTATEDRGTQPRKEMGLDGGVNPSGTQSSDDSDNEEEEFGEVSILIDSESVTASQQVNSGDLKERLLSYIQENKDLYLKVLHYQPLELVHLHQQIKSDGINCQLGKLIDFLDEQCITFTTAGSRPAQRTRGRTRKKRTKKK